MTEDDFESLKRGLDDARAFMAGDTSRGRVAAIGVDVKAIRQAIGMSQPKFAEAFQIPVGTLRDWEQGRRVPDAPARALLKVIAADPERAAAVIGA